MYACIRVNADANTDACARACVTTATWTIASLVFPTSGAFERDGAAEDDAREARRGDGAR
jgi:hypothetical protein